MCIEKGVGIDVELEIDASVDTNLDIHLDTDAGIDMYKETEIETRTNVDVMYIQMMGLSPHIDIYTYTSTINTYINI